MNSDMILKADNLHFSYDDDNSHSLNGLSLEIRRGQKVAFMGANGSGKSTFFLCCTGIHKPQSGKLYFNGEEVNYNKKGLLHLRSKVGIVFQDPDNQLFSASVYQEISFGILNLGVSKTRQKKKWRKSLIIWKSSLFSPQTHPCFKWRTEKAGFHCRHSVGAPGHYYFRRTCGSFRPQTHHYGQPHCRPHDRKRHYGTSWPLMTSIMPMNGRTKSCSFTKAGC